MPAVPADSVIPVIDLFAGPGGLGEGFSALGRKEGKPRFNIRLSIEEDPIAHQTLELRAFIRQFPHGDAPNDYCDHVKGKLSREHLYARHGQPNTAAARTCHCF
jgi:DNA (cytosine-5)-methyltransferase 1